MTVEKVYRTIEQSSTRLGNLLKELVAVDTTNPPGRHYVEMVNLLKKRCEGLGLHTTVIPVPESETLSVLPHADAYPRLNLIARWDVGANKTIHFNAHYDVVPAAGNWRFPPFAPEIEDEWLYGRGADDMKDSIAALLFAILSIRENNLRPVFNIECSFTCDEEIGGELGAGYLVQNRMIQADYVVNCEGGSLLNVGVGHNGVIWMNVTVHGVAAHASQPEKGLNAFEKMVSLVSALQLQKERLAPPDRVFATNSGQHRRPTISIGGVFHGTDGDKVNTVPAQATFSIDRRVIPSENLEEVEQEIREIIKDICIADSELRVEVNTILSIAPCIVDVGHPFVQAFGEAVRVVRERPPSFSATSGFTDLHFFVVDGGLPGVGYGVDGESAHGVDERVSITDLVAVAKIYATLMMMPHASAHTLSGS